LRWLAALAKYIESAITKVSGAFNVIGVIAVGVLMLVITSDVLGRFIFNNPITGTVDISQYVMVIAVYLAVSYCALVKGHVSVDLIVAKFSQRGQAIIDSVTGFVSLVLFSLIAWQSVFILSESRNRGEASMTVGIPSWPFRAILLAGIVMLCLVLVVDLVHLVAKAVKK